eukprot:IDg2823t1
MVQKTEMAPEAPLQFSAAAGIPSIPYTGAHEKYDASPEAPQPLKFLLRLRLQTLLSTSKMKAICIRLDFSSLPVPVCQEYAPCATLMRPITFIPPGCPHERGMTADGLAMSAR